MMSSAIEALYIYKDNREPILEHVYRSRPLSARAVLPLYLAQPAPRPSVIYLPSSSPRTTLFSLTYANLLFIVPTIVEAEPLLVLEFLHRFVDVLEEFLGSPLVATRIEGSYDVVAQLLSEMCDAGTVCNTEANVLKDVIDVPGWIDKLLGGVGLPSGTPPSLGGTSSSALRPSIIPQFNSGPAIPWRRSNVRHTSNELYVDIVETLSVIFAPSGRSLSAFASGSVRFTAKISGVPDLLLKLSVPGGSRYKGHNAVASVIELPVFHPCVRLSRWKEKPGELSFIPPDGKFMLAGYEVNLLPLSLEEQMANLGKSNKPNLPLSIEVVKSLGTTGSEFEVRVSFSSNFARGSGLANPKNPFGRPGLGSASSSGRSTPSFFGGASSGTSSAPTVQNIVVTVPVSKRLRNISDLRASRGEAKYDPGEHVVEWQVSSKEAAAGGSATLRCTIVGPPDDDDKDEEDGGNGNAMTSAPGRADYNEYDEGETYQPPGPVSASSVKQSKTEARSEEKNQRSIARNEGLMPSSAAVSFSVKGWLASGIKVESLLVDTRKSRGLGEGVKPVKGAKYLTVSNKGVETRC